MDIKDAFSPLFAYWVATEGFVNMANFVNSMRDSVISARLNGQVISHLHRETIRVDWTLTMFGFIFASLGFSAVLWLLTPTTASASVATRAASVVTFLGSILFAACALSDARAMRDNTTTEEKR